MELFKKSGLDSHTLSEIKKLHIQTRRLVDQGMAGGYRSAFRGRGVEFEEVREYMPGDDVRSIDWKVTARMGRPYLKSYREERELTVMIAVDVSRSTLTGTQEQLRETLLAKIGALLTLVALSNNDKVGLVTFSDRLETYHPPRKARSAVWRILHEVLAPGRTGAKTDLSALFSFLSGVLKKRSVIFVLSDFFAGDFELPLAVLCKRHDVNAVIARDRADFALPAAGMINVRDPETGQTMLLDSAYSAASEWYRAKADAARADAVTVLRKHKADVLELYTDRPFLPDIRAYFERRRARR